MSSGLNPDEEREKERQQRDGELLRQISTPNVATVVLLAALVKDFSPSQIRANSTPLARWMLGFFFFSLLCAMGGLFFNVTLGRRVAKGVRAIAAVAYLFLE